MIHLQKICLSQICGWWNQHIAHIVAKMSWTRKCSTLPQKKLCHVISDFAFHSSIRQLCLWKSTNDSTRISSHRWKTHFIAFRLIALANVKSCWKFRWKPLKVSNYTWCWKPLTVHISSSAAKSVVICCIMSTACDFFRLLFCTILCAIAVFVLSLQLQVLD